MSMITENTVVINKNDNTIEDFNNAVKYHAAEYGWIGEPSLVFENEQLAIFILDCNGQPLGVEEKIEWLILETNFFDGEEPYTQYCNREKNYWEEPECRAIDILKDMLDEESFLKVKKAIMYSTDLIDDEFSFDENIKPHVEQSDVLSIEERIEKMFIREAEDYNCSIEEVKKILIEEWGEGGDRGYGVFMSDEPELEHIERIDILDVYDGDLEAAAQAEKDGIKLIPFEVNPKQYPYNCYQFLDTPENRKALEKIIKTPIDVLIDSAEQKKKSGFNNKIIEHANER